MMRIKCYNLWLFSIGMLPFFHGGYFLFETYAFGTIQGMIYLWNGRKKGKRISGTRAYLLLVLVGIQMVSLPFSVDPGLGVLGLLKSFVFLLFLSNLVYYNGEGQNMDEVWKVLIISGAGLVVLSIGILGVNPLYIIQNQRIGGLFQYANSFGIYLLFLWIMTFKELGLSSKKVLIIQAILSMGIAMTLSRGVIYLWLVTAVILWIWKKNWKGMIVSGSAGAVGVAIACIHQLSSVRLVNPLVESSQWLSRILYYKDGLTILRDHMMGLGYMGYSHIQSVYITGANYHVKFIHNSFLQLLLDYGILVGLLVVLLVVTGLYRLYKEKKWLEWMGILVLIIHSIIDFDMEFSVCVFLLFLCLGGDEGGEEGRKTGLIPWGLMTGLLAYMSFAHGAFYFNHLDLSLKLYPYNTEVVSALIEARPGGSNTFEWVESAVDRNPYYREGFAFFTEYYYNNGDFEEAFEEAGKVVALAPLDIKAFEAYVDIGLTYLRHYHKEDDDLLDEAYFVKAIEWEDYFKDLSKNKSSGLEVQHKVDFQVSDALLYKIESLILLYNRIR